MDIVIGSEGAQSVGFLASGESDYAKIICRIMRMSADVPKEMNHADEVITNQHGNTAQFFLLLAKSF